ncbi:DUF2303 family protein [Actinomadura terrae]|uniref:DUF2303 family protein n=1 Tax=Actinomadura terrae TaxID=604353 RepID=UPI001FA766DF|nr:DUF2303 family protein [Actinomadura terrae]
MTYSTTRTETVPPVPRTENDALIEVATMATEPNLLEPGKVYGWMSPTGRVHLVDLTGDQYRDRPRRKIGTFHVRDVESFGAYWDKHADTNYAEVYADPGDDKVVAVLDAHGSTVPGWCDHRLVFTLNRTVAWRTWTSCSGDLMGQTAFAELLEDRLGDIAEPDGAELLELAQTFTANTEVAFKSGALLANGSRELVYSESVEASGGRGGKKIAIPKRLVLMLAPYEGAEPVPVTARFRYRISDGHLRLGVVLDRPEEVLAASFAAVVEQLAARIAADVMVGWPA